jgi:hypothetical protein
MSIENEQDGRERQHSAHRVNLSPDSANGSPPDRGTGSQDTLSQLDYRWGQSWRENLPSKFLSPHVARATFQSISQGDPLVPAEELRKISIAVEEEAWHKTFHLIDQNPLEVCWLGLVRFEPETLTFVWYDVLVPGQTSRPTTFDVSADQAGTFFEELLNEPGQTHEEIVQWFPHLKLHGHSHVHMGVEASDTDDRFINRILSKSSEPFYVRVIGNKRGMLQFTLFLIQEDVMIVDVPWSIRGTTFTRYQSWAKEVSKAKVQRSYSGMGPGALDFDPARWRRLRPLWPNWKDPNQEPLVQNPHAVPAPESHPQAPPQKWEEDCWLMRLVRAIFGLNSPSLTATEPPKLEENSCEEDEVEPNFPMDAEAPEDST